MYGCIPSCCNLPDMISKVYFDRGPWDKFCCLRAIGCVTGPPVFFGHVRKLPFMQTTAGNVLWFIYRFFFYIFVGYASQARVPVHGLL
jgi:hypothetical protein